ncbi:MAG: cation diffusion facilitator family transporter [Thermoanaerobaculia bacterium]
MAHLHGPTDRRTRTSRKLLVSTAATLAFFGLELAAGIFANALSLIADAFHNITDAAALMLAWLAVRLERRPATPTKSFGYQRAGVLAAFVNAAMLIVLTVFVFIEAFQRLRAPEPVGSGWMLGVAGVALFYNLGVTFWLRHEGRHDINVRGAMLHMLGDGIASAGVIVAAVLIRVTGSTVWDAIVSIIIGGIIIWTSWGILRETINLLLEGTPRGIEPDEVRGAIAEIEGVFDVHHVHIWALGPSGTALSAHLLLGDVTLRRAGDVLRDVNTMLAERWNIHHTTIQLEVACPGDDPACVPIGRVQAAAAHVHD